MPDGTRPTRRRPAGAPRRYAPAEVWHAVRADYMAGLPAHECCRRHGVTMAALRARAARNGWRRIDQPWTPANALDPTDEGVQLEQRSEGDLDRIDTCELIFVAHRRMLRCSSWTPSSVGSRAFAGVHG